MVLARRELNRWAKRAAAGDLETKRAPRMGVIRAGRRGTASAIRAAERGY